MKAMLKLSTEVLFTKFYSTRRQKFSLKSVGEQYRIDKSSFIIPQLLEFPATGGKIAEVFVPFSSCWLC